MPRGQTRSKLPARSSLPDCGSREPSEVRPAVDNFFTPNHVDRVALQHYFRRMRTFASGLLRNDEIGVVRYLPLSLPPHRNEHVLRSCSPRLSYLSIDVSHLGQTGCTARVAASGSFSKFPRTRPVQSMDIDCTQARIPYNVCKRHRLQAQCRKISTTTASAP